MEASSNFRPLGSVAKVRSGYAFKSEDMGTVGLPIIKIKNVVPPSVDVTDCERVPEEVLSSIPNIERFELKEGDTLIAMTGATVGKIGKFPRTQERHFLNQRVGKVYLTEPEAADYRYIYYILSQDTYVRQMFGIADGSAQANISGSQIENLEVPLPALPEQKAIAAILGALDDKIELNRRMNATLEAMARALFQSWFVDFDPVRAKLDGRKPEGMDEATAAVFPAKFQESKLGPLPNRWHILTVDEICKNIFSGGTPSTQNASFWGGDIPWLSSGETRDRFIVGTEKTITPAGVENSSTRSARAGCTVIAGAGQGHTRGQTSLLTFDSYINQSVVALEADLKVSSDLFLFFNLSRRYEEFRQLSDSHSSRGSLTTKLLAGVEIVLPPLELIERFDGDVSPLVERITVNLHQSRTLAALRDTLLPKLLSGELSVKAIAKDLAA